MDDPFSRFDNRLETDTLTTKIQPLSLSIGNYYWPQKMGVKSSRQAEHITPLRHHQKMRGKKNKGPPLFLLLFHYTFITRIVFSPVSVVVCVMFLIFSIKLWDRGCDG